MTATATTDELLQIEPSFKQVGLLFALFATLGLTASALGYANYGDMLINGGAMGAFFATGWIGRGRLGQ